MADDFAGEVRRRLDALAAAGRHLELWWRDDDAQEVGPALARLLDIAGRYGVPLCLAVIPHGARPGLAAALAAYDRVWVSQHGWAHANHEPAGSKVAELGSARPPEVVLAELADGRRALQDLFGARFRPVLTPPWNRVDGAVASRRREAGLPGLSTFAGQHAGDALCRNTHLDPIAWRRGRAYLGDARMLRLLDEELAVAERPPLGLLTHHLAHDAGIWAFVEAFVAAAADHPAVRWPGPEALFPGLSAAAARGGAAT